MRLYAIAFAGYAILTAALLAPLVWILHDVVRSMAP